MSFKNLTDFYVAQADYISDLEERAGIPMPCPRCGGPVEARFYEKKFWEVACADVDVLCSYRCSIKQNWQDAWREHERMCKEAEEDEG